ncbi:stage III sporulation protein AE [Papillibacter cinnamivorans]|uniref:Stage III sporulation protein AE n=1 Tax=Papillibacter cinnamivorans DSM 12816 TaxID=1122930 RepID=A0A1W2CKR6_9FIRM|nr:stage III sporulation protein AE [Papillibacter cinnamivorans]SMC85574.1 stage III sporulation protein AE [Papillibacter cinnamivorans DSM 12816]
MKQLIAIFAVLCLLTTAAAAEGFDDAARQSGALDTGTLEEAVPSGAQDLMDGAEIDQGEDLGGGIAGILQNAGRELESILKGSLRSGVLLLSVVLLCAVAGSLYEGTASKTAANFVPTAGTLAVTAIAVGDIHTLIGLGLETISQIENFSKVLLPTLAAATAASGSVGGAAARQMATVLFSDVVLTAIDRLLMPLVYAYIAAQAANAAIENNLLGRVAGMLKWAVTTILTMLLICFTGYLTVSGAIAGTADAVTIKAAKFAMSGAVPVVGGIISDAAETVLVGAGVLRNTVGVFGMLTILAICIIPFLRLGVQYLMYKLTAAMAGTVGDDRVVRLIDGIGGAFGLVLGMTGACALILLISIVSSVKAVTG